ncbi:hypothetical protein COO60DRAFT_177984 [Scenedesmus sp. NREL 46B-D3]|nr:hypothetical protein COO60DRAFT_177984 [Scenedesmus sp. NREL 46B-D3]
MGLHCVVGRRRRRIRGHTLFDNIATLITFAAVTAGCSYCQMIYCVVGSSAGKCHILKYTLISLMFHQWLHVAQTWCMSTCDCRSHSCHKIVMHSDLEKRKLPAEHQVFSCERHCCCVVLSAWGLQLLAGTLSVCAHVVAPRLGTVVQHLRNCAASQV